MLQFTPAEIAALKERAETTHSWIIGYLEEEIKPFKENYRIQEKGLATWSPLYVCPEDHTPLTFNVKDAQLHKCPTCGNAYTGEPYYGAWWCIMNTLASNACRYSGLLFALTGKKEHFNFAKRILHDYATNYPNYEVHGNIPHNTPGRVNARAITDAIWIRGLLSGYDYIRGQLHGIEQNYIETQILKPAAEFFMKQREEQLHNHEMIVSATVGIIGLFLWNRDLIEFALDSKYGIRYQLEYGLLSDDFWFEGSTSYHFYAIEQIVAYEMFARHTHNSLLGLPRLRRAINFPLNIIQPDGNTPQINDIGVEEEGFGGHENIFEMLHAAYAPDDELAFYLERCYDGKERRNYFAFVYGSEYEIGERFIAQDYHDAEGSGLSTLIGPDGRYLLFKHAPFGGEHDHYDRLGIHFMAFGKLIAPDLGTCRYGEPLHHGYYKNTGTHNTICLNGKNQPPENCRVNNYEQNKDYTLIDCITSWDGGYKPLDSFAIERWDNQIYHNARLRRIIAWYGDFFIDVFDVSAPNAETIDWILHLRATPAMDSLPTGSTPFSNAEPYSHLTLLGEHSAAGNTAKREWDAGDDVRFTLYSHAPAAKFLLLEGPDNPATDKLSYAIQRTDGRKAMYVNVLCCEKADAPVLSAVDVSFGAGGKILVNVTRRDGKQVEFRYEL
jgi:hypothetical protein